MTIPDTIYDTINDNWGAGGYAGVAPAIDTTETQTSSDEVTANVIEVRAHTLRERGEQKNDVYVNRHYTLDVYISTKTSAAQLTLLYDEVEYLLRNTAMTGIQIEYMNKDWSMSQWEQGRHSVVLRVAVVALLSDGAVTSAAGVTASMQALLMYGSANAAWVPMVLEGSGSNSKYYVNAATIINLDGTDIYYMFRLPIPTLKGSLKLYVSGVRVGIQDADADDYITETLIKGDVFNGSTNILLDATNYDSPQRMETLFAAHDCSTYDSVHLTLLSFVTTGGDLDLVFVNLRCYYDT